MDDLFDSKISDPLKVYQQRVNNSLQFLKNQPAFTEQNIHSWHENILHIQESINTIAKGKQITGELEQLCKTNEQLRMQFDYILQEQYPHLRDSIRKKLEISQVLKNERVSAALSRSFNYGSQVSDKEDRQTEFKNYTLASFQEAQFRDAIKKTMVSFLNQLGGTIFVGIRDYDMTVQGVDLTIKDMDTLKLHISDIRRQIEPDCNILVNVDFIPVMQWGSFSNGKWIVRIKVSQGELNTLYAYKLKQDDPYVFSSAFREDGSSQRYELSKFIFSSKQIHQYGRQPAVAIEYAAPHDQAYLCESNQVKYPDQKCEIKGKYIPVQQGQNQNNNLQVEYQMKMKQLEDENKRLYSELKTVNKNLNEKNILQKDSLQVKGLLVEIKDLTQELNSVKEKYDKNLLQNQEDTKQIAELTSKYFETNDENKELKQILMRNQIQFYSKNQQIQDKISSYPDNRHVRIEYLDIQSADSQQRKEFKTPLKINSASNNLNYQAENVEVNKFEDFSRGQFHSNSNNKQQKVSTGKHEAYPREFIKYINLDNNQLEKPSNPKLNSNQKDRLIEENYGSNVINRNRLDYQVNRNDEEDKKQYQQNNNRDNNSNSKSKKNPFLAEVQKGAQLEDLKNQEEITKSDLNNFQSWIMISSRRKDESEKAILSIKQILNEEEYQFKTLYDQNIVVVFFKNNNNNQMIQKYETVIEEIQPCWLKILFKTSRQDISEIFFGKTISQIKNQDNKMSFPVLLFDNIKETEVAWSQIQKIFGKQDIKKIKPNKYYTILDEHIINNITGDQIKSIRRDKSVERIGSIVGKQVQISGKDLDEKLISDYLKSCLIFLEFKVQMKYQDQIVVEFGSSLDALIGQLKLEESRLDGIELIKLDEIMDVPLKF